MTPDRKEHKKEYNKAYAAAHKEELKAYRKEYHDTHKEEARAYREAHKEELKIKSKQYNETHKEERKQSRKAYRQSNKQKLSETKRERTAVLLSNGRCACGHKLDREGKSCSLCIRNAIKRHNQIKDAAFNTYGGYVCNCCGETTKPFLTIDHINNDGWEHRKHLGSGGHSLYSWLRKNNYPPGFQVLCMNCNFGKGKNGGVCPHQTQATQPLTFIA